MDKKQRLLFFSCLATGDNMEFKELRKLNNLEKIYMIKSYIEVYLVLMLKNDKEKQFIKEYLSKK